MKRAISFIVGILMVAALLVGSGDPTPDATSKQIILTELACVAVLALGSWYLWHTYKDEIKDQLN